MFSVRDVSKFSNERESRKISVISEVDEDDKEDDTARFTLGSSKKSIRKVEKLRAESIQVAKKNPFSINRPSD